MAAKEDRRFTVGPGTQFIFHRKDRRNYWPGQTFILDHLTADEIKRLEVKGATVDVTGKSEDDIAAMVAAYKPFTAAQIKAAMQSMDSYGDENES